MQHITHTPLPRYTHGEELANTLTHALGILFGFLALSMSLNAALDHHVTFGFATSVIYGLSLIAVYTTSSIYHALPRCIYKRVLRVLDHCMIYLLIAGTYTPILVCAIIPKFPAIGWSLLALVWSCAVVAIVFTAIDLKKYSILSMICYICMGWCILPAASAAIEALSLAGFLWVLFGGIAYTIGAILYGIGKKHRYMHAVFHGFVVLGSALQFVGILRFVL